MTIWIPLWTAWRNSRRWRQLSLQHLAAIKAEVITDNLEEARWIVREYDGHIRYVVSNLYARLGDVAIPNRDPE